MSSQALPSSPLIPRSATQRARLGVHVAEAGLDIVVAAENATAVEFCLFEDASPHAHEQRWQLRRDSTGLWQGHLPGHGAGSVYGFRAWGPWQPGEGHVYNPNKLLIDPYARGLSGEVTDEAATYAHQVDKALYPAQPLQPNSVDSAPYVPRSVVVAPSFPIAPHPRTPWNKTVIYEAHVRGFTRDLPGIPEELQGTYAGLAHPVAVNYLKRLGITAIELLPIHAKHDEMFLTERGLTNYWGYSTLSYFTPEPRYATAAARLAGPQAVLNEVCGMVSILHQAGIEVILDVVYNHTCEGSLTERSLSWRGLDNRMYYLSDPSNPAVGWDVTGCGNSLDFSHRRVIQMTLDSLRYWAEEVGVDGFRFDLGVTLGRFGLGFTPQHPFLIAAGADPVIGATKLISEPWDIGPSGWQTGNFPIPFSDWNDRFRDCVRSFWLTDIASQVEGNRPVGALQDLATRLSGSADLFWTDDTPRGRGPRASINFITAHDGFTMADLVTYNHKHNYANLESNHDGTDNNHSWNHGSEGSAEMHFDAHGHAIEDKPSDLLPARLRSVRNMMATLLISAGTPMLVAGDEFWRSQGGNNNAYCQDNEISWLDWHWEGWQQTLFDSVRTLIDLRRKHPVMRPTEFAIGAPIGQDVLKDLTWYDRAGLEMTPQHWSHFDSRVLQMLRSGQPYGDNDMLVLINGTTADVEVTLASGRGSKWELAWDSANEHPAENFERGQIPGSCVPTPAEQPHVTLSRQSLQIYFAQY